MSLPLTVEERDLMLEMISEAAGFNDGRNVPTQVGIVTLEKLAEYRAKDNDLIRAELVIYRARKAAFLKKTEADIQANLIKIQAQLDALTPKE